MSPQLGFIGLGGMGYFMARNLAKSLPEGAHLLVWNRSVEKSQKLQQEVGSDKIIIADSLEVFARTADFIFSNLANDTVVKDVYTKLVDALKGTEVKPNKTLVEMSTVYPTTAVEVSKLVATIPARFIQAPIFGAPPAAEGATLLVILAGNEEAKKEIEPVLVPAVGRKALDLGSDPEKAADYKLVGNSLILGGIELLAEVFTFGEKVGVGQDRVEDLVKELMPNPILLGYANRIANDRWNSEKGFALEGGLKDAGHIRRLAADVNSPIPAIDTAYQHLLTARAIHRSMQVEGQEVIERPDWSSLVSALRVGAGLHGFDSSKNADIARKSA